jgi:hypothetical protein
VCDPGEDSCNCSDDCGAPPSNEIDCSDGIDNDCDGLIDGDDLLDCPLCGNGVCDPGEDSCSCSDDCGAPPSNEIDCSDGIDNDCDGNTDCQDSDCFGDSNCEPPQALSTVIVGEGTVLKDPDESAYAVGEVVTLTAVPDLGWEFNRWEGDVSGVQNPTQLTIDGNPSVIAIFATEDCGTGLCATGVGGTLPFMVLGLCVMKIGIRRRQRWS